MKGKRAVLENEPAILKRVEDQVHSRMSDDCTGHDWWHVDRVRRTSIYICKREGGNPFIVELVALLHDVDDWKFQDDEDQSRGARNILEEVGVSDRDADKITRLIEQISFKGAGVSDRTEFLESRIVQDADRLDAIGAIGIARCFAYGGNRNRPIHDPEQPPFLHSSFEEYKNKSGPSINHFHEKLLLLKDRLHTDTARRLAESRHEFLEEFLRHFESEWNFPARDGNS